MNTHVSQAQETHRHSSPSHGNDIHPGAVTPFYLIHVIPLTLIPSATVMYAWQLYHKTVLQWLDLSQAITLCFLAFLIELTAFPIMSSVVLSIHHGAHEKHYLKGDAPLLCLAAPVVLWLSQILLFVPALVVPGLVFSLLGSGLLVFLGTRTVIMPKRYKDPKSNSWSVVEVAELGWILLSLLAVFTWGVRT